MLLREFDKGVASFRAALPKTRPFLMYGLTESFRSTYLPPSEIDRRPDSAFAWTADRLMAAPPSLLITIRCW